MPQAVNLTINNNAAVAKTFTLLSPASGYGVAALWALKEGAISTIFPRIGVSVKRQASKAAKTEISVRVPSSYVDSTTGLTKAGPTFDFHGYATMPDDFPESAKADAVAYTKNAVGHAVIVACMTEGTPAT